MSSTTLKAPSTLPPFKEKLISSTSKLKFPIAAQRYTPAQLEQVWTSRYWMRVVLVDKHGLVLANFASVLQVDRTPFGQWMCIVREKDLSRAQARWFANGLRKLAKANKWDKDILDVELQYLRKLV